MMNRRFLVALLLAFVATSTLAQQDFARIKVIHAYPGLEGPTVDIFISTGGFIAKSLLGVPYKGASDWFYVPYGEYSVEVKAGTTIVHTQDVTVDVRSAVIIAAQTKGLSLFPLEDNIDSIPAGDAHVTIGHFAAFVGAVDVGVGASPTLLAEDLGFAGSTSPVPVEAGTYTAEVRPTGTTGTPLLTLQVTLEARKHYLVLAVGALEDEPNPAPELVAYELADYSINARVAFVHGLPAANLPVNVIANGALDLFRNVNYKNITDYKNIPVGTHTITVENEGDAAITVIAFFNGFSESTLYATASGDGPAGILLMDDNTAPTSGNVRLRVLHGAGEAPAVDVLSSGTAVIENLAYGLASGYLSLPDGTYSLSVNAAGSQTSVFSVSLTLSAGPVITVLATGDLEATDATAFTLVVVTDATYGENGNLRAFHAVAGGPVVNIKADGTEVFSDVPFKGYSTYSPVPPGLYRVSVHVASDDDELFRSPIRVDAEGYFTAVAGGTAGTLSLFQLRDDNSPPDASTTHLRVVHASATSPEVNLQVNGATVGALVYTETFGYVPLPSTSYVVRVATTETNTQVFNESLALEANTVISAWAVGEVGNNDAPFEVVVTLDFDYRTPAAPAAPTSAPSASPSGSTPTRTPTRTSSASVATTSVALMAAIALLF